MRFGGKFDKKFLTALWLLFIGKTIAVEVRMFMHGREAGVAVSSAPSSGFILSFISAENSSWHCR